MSEAARRYCAQLTREQAAELALEPGDSVFIAPRAGDARTRSVTFEPTTSS